MIVTQPKYSQACAQTVTYDEREETNRNNDKIVIIAKIADYLGRFH